MKIIFHIKDYSLKVRHAQGHEPTPYKWEDKLEFGISDSPNFTILWTSFLPDLEPEYARSLLRLIGARYPLTSGHEDLLALCPELVFKTTEDEWVFFGGTFNPWHGGHQACLKLLDDSKVCLMLPDRNPFKELRDIEPVSTILELSSRIHFKKKQFLVPTFLLETKKNPTVEWVEGLKKKFPQQKLSLLLGFDSFQNIDRWTRSQDLLNSLHALYVVSRMETEATKDKAVESLKQKAPNLNVTFLGRHEFEHLSSTELRKR